jgi:ATP-dependent Clp protease ATP-binding subunit ClpX
MQEIDTSGILFICGGAFVGLDKVIEQRQNKRSIGFNSSVSSEETIKNIFREVTTKDIIQYGFIPEFVGRFGLITNVDELTEDQLIEVMKDKKNSPIQQYQYLFEIDGVTLEFEESALKEIARKAKELKTNARGIKNILERTLLPYQFDAINLVERGLKKIVISKSTVEGKPATLIFDKKAKKNEQA